MNETDELFEDLFNEKTDPRQPTRVNENTCFTVLINSINEDKQMKLGSGFLVMGDEQDFLIVTCAHW